jgi:quercetin dioxygenase-like cupin family protein
LRIEGHHPKIQHMSSLNETMLVNADFSQPAIVTPDQFQWVASPQGGVERVMLDRVGGEQARATSIVRYAPASCFPWHRHPGGEEILVLSGTFSEEANDYPAGWYMRSPPGSSHRPFSEEGTVIFVKLRQMPPDDQQHVRIDTGAASGWERLRGRSVFPLFSSKAEQVRLQRLDPDEVLFPEAVDSAELLVLEGELRRAGRSYPRRSWVRLPKGEYPDWTSGGEGVVVYLKTGHLAGCEGNHPALSRRIQS